MSDQDSVRARGRCLCGDVRFAVHGELRDVIDCHCHRCRRWSGHHVAATSANIDDLEVSDEHGRLTWFEPVPEAAYAFCSRCGSSLFWRGAGSPSRWSICAGVLDPPTSLRTREAWWVSEASDYLQRPDLQERATEPSG